MKNWRPEGWEKNPTYPASWMTAEYLDNSDKLLRIYDLGADAMLEAIKELGEYTEFGKPTIIRGMTENNKGWLVFIPDKGG